MFGRNSSKKKAKGRFYKGRVPSLSLRKYKVDPSGDHLEPVGGTWPPYDGTYGFVDESGDLGASRDSSRQLVTSGVFTDRPLDIRYASAAVPWNTMGYKGEDDELKFRSSTDTVRTLYLSDLIRGDPDLYVVTTSKEGGSDVPRSGKPLIYDNLEQVLVMAASELDGPLYVVLDQHDALKQRIVDEICRRVERKTGVNVVILERKGKFVEYPELASPDMVSGARAYELDWREKDAERGQDSSRFIRMLEKRIRRMDRRTRKPDPQDLYPTSYIV